MSARQEKMRADAVAKLRAVTGWTVDEAWAFIEKLPYSTIPDEDDAIAVLEHLGFREEWTDVDTLG